MTKQLFNENIPPKCEYCLHSIKKDALLLCSRTGKAAVEPCRKYAYDPTMRPPRRRERLPEYPADAFRIN